MEKEAVILEKSNLNDWVQTLRKDYTVCGPVRGNKEFNFKEILPGVEMELEYVRTIIPPKKYLHPQREVLHGYNRENPSSWTLPEISKKTVVMGVHPCDARAMLVYDRIFNGDIPDPYYQNRRKNTIVVATTCTIPDDHCFCVSWEKDGPTMSDKGYDLLMTDIGDSYLVEIGTLEGSLLVHHPFFHPASEPHRESKQKTVEKSVGRIKNLIPDGAGIPDFLEKHYDSDVWDEETKKCTSCGTCTLVCPTCFCYHVEDLNRWNAVDGERVRIWDSCQLIDFAEVAMGENFRSDRGARLKWRIFHKLAHWQEQFGTLGCTGCGRCMEYCMAKIDMTKAIEAIRGESANA